MPKFVCEACGADIPNSAPRYMSSKSLDSFCSEECLQSRQLYFEEMIHDQLKQADLQMIQPAFGGKYNDQKGITHLDDGQPISEMGSFVNYKK